MRTEPSSRAELSSMAFGSPHYRPAAITAFYSWDEDTEEVQETRVPYALALGLISLLVISTGIFSLLLLRTTLQTRGRFALIGNGSTNTASIVLSDPLFRMRAGDRITVVCATADTMRAVIITAPSRASSVIIRLLESPRSARSCESVSVNQSVRLINAFIK